ncbi:MAG: DUF488 domain-containing protein [Candidatus Micrarchaeaceae archaeon]
MIKIKRIYDTIEVTDGIRILVDRLWPRGVRRSSQKVDYWAKDVAPSNELRKWFGHDPSKWEEFRKRYIEELETENNGALEKFILRIKGNDTITLLYSSKDVEHNNAIVLAEVLKKELEKATTT